MADYSVPTPQLALSEKPQTQIDASVFNRPLQTTAVAQGAEQLGQGAEDLAEPLAKQQAQDDLQKGIMLDANGTPQVATPLNSLILGRAGQQYAAAVTSGLTAGMQSAVTNEMTTLRQQNLTDPQAFRVGANARIQQIRSNPDLPPETANALADHAQNMASQHFASMTEQGMTRETQMSEQAIKTNIADTQNKMAALARQQATGTPEYQALQTQLETGIRSLGSNPLFGYSPTTIQSMSDTAKSELQSEQIVGAVDAVFNKKGGDGGKAGAQAMLDREILNNPALNLSDAQRKQFYSAGMAHLQYLTSEQKAAIDANRPAINDGVTVMRTDPSKMDEGTFQRLVQQAGSIGDAEGVLRLQAARLVSQQNKFQPGLTPEQQLNAAVGGNGSGSEKQAFDYFVSKGWSPVQASGIVGNLLHESGLKTSALAKGDGSDGSDSIGLAQWNSTRAANLKTFAAQQGKSPTDFQTQLAFVQHELETSEAPAAQSLRQATTPQAAAAAFALGYERPQGFMTGDINQVAGGSARVANAVRLAGGGASSALVYSRPSANGVPFTSEQLKNPFVLSEYVHSIATDGKTLDRLATGVGSALETQLAGGNMPNATTVASYLQVAATNPDKFGEQSQKIQASLAGLNAASGLSSAGGDGEAVLAAAKQQTQGGSIFQLQVADAAQKAYTQQTEALKKTPFEEATRRGWLTKPPTAIDLSPQGIATLPQAMAEHGQAATIIGSYMRNAATPAFSPGEVGQIKSVMTSGPIDQRVALAGAIVNSGMPQPVLRATLEQLGNDRATRPLAIAGDVYQFAPVVAHDIIQGQALMQAEPKLAPNKDDYPSEFAKAMPFNDLPDSPARQNYDAAIQALYAKRSADANDTTGVLNQSRLDDVIHDVTGGIVDWRGGKAIAPWYGASQGQYDAAIRMVSDADLARSRGSDGIPLPASALKPSFASKIGFAPQWSLQSFDGGKYLVYPNNGVMPRQYLKDVGGRNFVLDLGPKRQAVEAQGARLADPPFSDSGLATYLDEQAR